jgi:type II secretion system protein D
MMLRLSLVLSFLISASVPGLSFAQQGANAPPAGPVPPPPAAEKPPAKPGDEEMLQLTFPENVEVKVLLDYVTKRLGMNILYDQGIVGKRITLSSPTKIPMSSLLGLLESVLKMSGLALVDADQKGWKRVVPSQEIFRTADGFETDFSKLVKASAGTPMMQVFEMKHVTVQAMQQFITPFMSKPGGNCFTVPDRNLLFVTDYADDLRRIALFIEMMDVPEQKASIRFVPVQYVDAQTMVRQVTGLLQDRDKVSGGGGKYIRPGLLLTVEPRKNRIIVISTDNSEAEVIELIKALDVPTENDPERSYVRFYKLMNATAAEVLATIRAIDAGGKGMTALAEEVTSTRAEEQRIPGTNNPPPPPGQELPKPPIYRPEGTEAKPLAAPSGPAALTVKTKDATVTADANTNTIIVVAPPVVQTVYQQLIAALDKRRPQVMVEVTLITLDTSDGYSLGVELSRPDEDGNANSTLFFSSFGLSTVNPATGALTPGVSAGFNSSLLRPDAIDIVIKALASSGRAKVLSAPKVLVNDHATATISSVSESPFTSVNASQTVSTTSFAGYASAGTTVTVTPHIGEGDHLQLKYSISLNSFTGSGGNGIPPPRQTNSISSEVVVPDAFAVVVGGISRESSSLTVSKVPGLGDVPIFGYLFGNRSVANSQSTLFAFIRPVILRNDRFEDLKYLSEPDLKAADMPGDLPRSLPLLMH